VKAPAWGWRKITVGVGDSARIELRPQGKQVGWTDGENLYLQSDSAYKAAQQMARDGGEGLALNPTTLWKRLNEKKLLVSREPSQETLKVRVLLQGKRQWVLHLLANSLMQEKPVQPVQPGSETSQKTTPQVDDWTGFQDRFSGNGQKPVQKTCPEDAESTRPRQASGQVGQVLQTSNVHRDAEAVAEDEGVI
jgi:hypothetical protein